MTGLIGYSVFVLIMLTLNTLLHVYLWRRFISAPQMRGPWRVIVGALITVFALLVPFKFGMSRLFVRDNLSPLTPVVWTWLGFAFFALLIFVPTDLYALLKRRRTMTREGDERGSGPGSKAPAPHPSSEQVDRRTFVSRGLALSTSLAAGGATTYGVVSANGAFHLPEVAVSLERLPRQLDGFKIVHLSDIHIGPVLDGRFVDEVVAATNKLKPDLVCITGDLVDGSISEIGPEIARLAKINARYGVAFTNGNHEYYAGAGPWMSFFEALGFHMLKNQRISVGDKGPGGASFDLAGIHDRQGGRFHPSLVPDLDAALAGRDPDRELVLMAHQPAQIAMAEGKGVGLQLSGHTHGGQVLPFGLVTRFIQPYLQGHSTHGDGTQIYVSCGTGYWGPPLRVGAPPEVASIILTC